MSLSNYLGGESTYLKASDLPEGTEVELSISGVEIEAIKNDDGEKDCIVLYFDGKQKGLVLNVVNGRKVISAYGDEKKNLIGKPILLYRDTTQFKGEIVPCLRVRIPTENVGSEDIPF